MLIVLDGDDDEMMAPTMGTGMMMIMILMTMMMILVGHDDADR